MEDRNLVYRERDLGDRHCRHGWSRNGGLWVRQEDLTAGGPEDNGGKKILQPSRPRCHRQAGWPEILYSIQSHPIGG